MEDLGDSSFASEGSSGGSPFQILITCMQDTGMLMDAQEELLDIEAAEHIVRKKDETRAAVVDRLKAELSDLQAQYQQAAAASQRPTGTPSAAEHEAHIRDLEQRQYAVGKALHDEEAAVARKQGELSRAKSERDEVNRWDPTAGEHNTPDTIRLNMYEAMGFKVSALEPMKILVRNDAKPDVHLYVDSGVDRVQSANRLWEYAG